MQLFSASCANGQGRHRPIKLAIFRLFLLVVFSALSFVAAAQNAFIGLGQFTASGMSKDGFTLVGSMQVSGDSHAAYWSNGSATDLNIGTSVANACSADGSVIVGWYINGSSQQTPYRWTSAGGEQDLPIPSNATNVVASLVSGDGKTVVIQYLDSSRKINWAAIWTATGGAVPLNPTDEDDGITLFAINQDGSVVGGEREQYDATATPNYGTYSSYTPAYINDGFSDTTLTVTPVCFSKGSEVSLPTPENHAEAVFSISDDGKRLYGGTYDAQEGSVFDLFDLQDYISEMTDVSPVQWVLSGTGSFSQTEGFEPLATSGDSSFAVGDQPVPVEAQGMVYDPQAMTEQNYDYFTMTQGNAIYWSPATGEENLITLLDDNGLASTIMGWSLSKATGISNSGTTIIGQGTDPTSGAESWMAYKIGDLSTLSLNTSSAVGGAWVTGTLKLDGYSGVDGETVTLSSNNVNATVASSVAVSAWATGGAFTIVTKPVSTAQSVTITATLGSVTKTVPLTIQLPVVLSFTLSSSSLVGGVGTTGTITVNGKAGPSGDTLTLSSNNANAGATPPEKIAAGATSVTFPVTTQAVVSNTSVTLTATLGSSSKAAALTITAPYTDFFIVAPTAVIGGQSTNAAVVISSDAAKAGAMVAITSSNTSVVANTTATVLGGDQVVPFLIFTKPVATSGVVTLTATLNGVAETATLTVEASALVNLRLTAPTLVGGNSMNVAVYLNGNAGPGGSTVNISSNNTALTVPASVIVPAGADAIAFSVSSVGVSTATPVTITAIKGPVTLKQTVTLEPATILKAVTAPTTVVGGKPITFGMYFTGKVGPSGLTVTLKSSSADVLLPATYNVVAGASTASFSVNTLAVKSLTSVTLTATVGSKSVTAVVSLSP